MQRMRLVMNLASFALILSAKTPRSREERRVESEDARSILADQQRFGRFL
jgi:hypothetical protein